MPDQSLLTDEVRALVGQESALGSVEVTLRGWRHAVEVYTGKVPGHTPAPGEPVSGYAIAALEVEDETQGLPSLLPSSILISNEWEFERQFRMGETLEASHRVVDVHERFGGRFGYSIDFRAEVVYRDSTGEIVARSGRTMTQYDPTEAKARDAAGREASG